MNDYKCPCFSNSSCVFTFKSYEIYNIYINYKYIFIKVNILYNIFYIFINIFYKIYIFKNG